MYVWLSAQHGILHVEPQLGDVATLGSMCNA